MLIGADFSHHNDDIIDDVGFVFLKASEGKSLTDNSLQQKLEKYAKCDNLPIIGFYHYAHPENNCAIDEANHFLNVVKPHIGKCLLALDFENKAHKVNTPEKWVIEFLEYIHNQTGVKPFFYTSKSYCANYKNVCKLGYPLWCAQYTLSIDRPITNTEWDNQPIIWQKCSNPIDIDLWFGTREQLIRYAVKE